MKDKERSIWEGKLMPTILRGSTAHNKALLEAHKLYSNRQPKLISLPARKLPAPIQWTRREPDEATLALYKRAKEILDASQTSNNKQPISSIATEPAVYSVLKHLR